MKNKLRAFTLMEIVVAMALSAIVTGIVYTSIQLVGSRYEVQSNSRNSARELEFFRFVFNNDVQYMNEIKSWGDDELLFTSTYAKPINYKFEGDYAVRIQSRINRIDTFRINIREIAKKDFQGGNNWDLPLQSIQMKAILNNDNIPLSFYKEYSAMDQMKYEEEER